MMADTVPADPAAQRETDDRMIPFDRQALAMDQVHTASIGAYQAYDFLRPVGSNLATAMRSGTLDQGLRDHLAIVRARLVQAQTIAEAHIRTIDEWTEVRP